MAPYKLEDNIREKLETRELKPSAEAWKKLEAKLDAEPPKKKPVLWYYVAASFLGFITLASVFYNQSNFEGNNRIVNETRKHVTTERRTEFLPNTSETKEITTDENSSEKVEILNVKNDIKENGKPNSNALKPLPQKKSQIDKKLENKDAIAEGEKTEERAPLKKTTQNRQEVLFHQKIEEVVASVKSLQENNTDVTATDVEALLKNARREIEEQRILNNPKVDAAALLQDVEWELEKSFRDKVFDALGEGFQKVRTAVTERNE